MPRTWRSIRVELLSGGQEVRLHPAPGRVLLVEPRRTFADFAAANDDAFARWDLNHQHMFELASWRTVADDAKEWLEDEVQLVDETRLRVASTVRLGDTGHRRPERRTLHHAERREGVGGRGCPSFKGHDGLPVQRRRSGERAPDGSPLTHLPVLGPLRVGRHRDGAGGGTGTAAALRLHRGSGLASAVPDLRRSAPGSVTDRSPAW